MIVSLSSDDTAESTELYPLIKECMDHLMYDDALALAEICYERTSSEESLMLMCQALYHLGRREELYQIMIRTSRTNPQVRYLFARLCFESNKVSECITWLRKDSLCPFEIHPAFHETPTATYAYALFAKALRAQGLHEAALNASRLSVSLNPVLWSNIKQAIQLGCDDMMSLMESGLEMTRVEIKMPSPEQSPIIPADEPVVQEKEADSPQPGTSNEDDLDDAFKTPTSCVVVLPTGLKKCKLRRSPRLTVFSNSAKKSDELAKDSSTKHFARKLSFESSCRPPRITTSTPNAVDSRKTPVGKTPVVRKAHCCLRGSRKVKCTPTCSPRGTSSFAPKMTQKITHQNVVPYRKTALYAYVFKVIKSVTSVEEALANYRWKDAQNMIEILPHEIARHSISVLQKARVVFELGQYSEAREILFEHRRRYPYSVELADLLSTSLWQMQRTIELSRLAQELTESHRGSPQTWCVAANCFSLEKRHGDGVECLRRAISIDSSYTYAYILLGHELIEMGESDAAIQAFRKAIEINPKEYRALYGLSMVNFRRDLKTLAKSDMKRAIALNPDNVAMLCHMANIENSLGKPENAKVYLERALALCPDNTVTKFYYAKLLLQLNETDECIRVLEELKTMSPDEPQIFFLLGKAYRTKNQNRSSMVNFNWAAEMDPRENVSQYSNERAQ